MTVTPKSQDQCRGITETESTGVGSHTLGPWKIRTYAVGTYGIYTEDGAGRGSFVGSIAPAPYEGDGEANARLIAAAPEMLSALELIAGHLGDLASLASKHDEDSVYWRECAGLQNLADEAIAKAKGCR